MVATGFAQGGVDGAGPFVMRLAATEGSAAHDWAAALAGDAARRRDLADAVHALCMLHGGHPGLTDDARAKAVQPEADAWLAAVADAFATERAVLAQLVAAAGPLPSTPGQADSEAAILAQRRTLSMLAASDRRGCATGAVAALTLDWRGVRRVLDRAAGAFGVDIMPSRLPSPSDAQDRVDVLAHGDAVQRAIGFGAAQLLAQHRGLWSLLEARAEARARA